jgi:hypothetical protein
VLPAFLILAFCMLLVVLSFLFLARETHRRASAQGIDSEEGRAPPAAVAR